MRVVILISLLFLFPWNCLQSDVEPDLLLSLEPTDLADEEKLPDDYVCGCHFVRGLLNFCMTMLSTGVLFRRTFI